VCIGANYGVWILSECHVLLTHPAKAKFDGLKFLLLMFSGSKRPEEQSRYD